MISLHDIHERKGALFAQINGNGGGKFAGNWALAQKQPGGLWLAMFCLAANKSGTGIGATAVEALYALARADELQEPYFKESAHG